METKHDSSPLNNANLSSDTRTESPSEKTPFIEPSFDRLLEKIGFGRYHLKVFLILGLLGIADGSESMVISFIVPIFEQVYPNSSINIEAVLGTCVYFGYLIGSLLSGYFSDKYGRRRPVLYAELLMTIFGLISAFPPGILSFIFLRSLFGIVVGFYSPLAYTILAEITPAKNRGKFMTLLGVFYTMGELVACLIAMITLENLDSGDWHGLLAFSSLPGLIAFFSTMFFLDESPRHELVLGNNENAFAVMEKMYKANNGRKSEIPLLTDYEKDYLINTQDKIRKQDEEENRTYGVAVLFEGKSRIITPIVWYNWFVTSFTYFGLTYILPTTLLALSASSSDNEDDNSVNDVFISCLAEFPTCFLAAMLVDVKGIGRKNFLALVYLVGGLACVISSFQAWPGFIAWISVSKFCFSLSFTLNYQYTSELYPTKYRGTGVGMASAFGRVGSIIMPIICTSLSSAGILLPYVAFGIASLLSFVMTTRIQFDTTGKTMDDIEKSLKQKI